MEKILFPMNNMRLTTGVNMMSHLGSNAIDIAGKDSGIESAFAPFTGTIKRIYKNGNTVWLESNSKVKFADGTEDYAVVSFTHGNDPLNLSVGKVVKQGEYFYKEGTNNAKGNHIHLEVGKGKYTGNGWYQNKYGNWVINSSYEPWKSFWLLENTTVLNGLGYPWKKLMEEDMIKDTDNEYARFALTSKFIRGRSSNGQLVSLSRDEFRKVAVGKSWLNVLESLEDDKEANRNLSTLQLGIKARDNEWEKQINSSGTELKPGKYIVK